MKPALSQVWRGTSSGPRWSRTPDALGRRLRVIVRLIRRCDFSAHSDGELVGALQRLKGHHGFAPEVFAVVDEAVRRRLGAWRLFDAGFDKGALKRYEDLAGQIIDASPYRDRIEFYSAPDFLDRHAFDRSIAPMLRDMGLDSDERAIVKAAVYVAEKRRTGQDSGILLPAEFYQAVAAKDRGGLLSFLVSDEQLTVGLLLSEKLAVEMNAGEGKTIAASFSVVAQALCGRKVHVITANDYLAARDRDWLAPVYESLGLSVGVVLSYMEDEERRHEYGQRIVYGTLREFGFDFMRDNLKLPPDEPVQGPLDVAIVDEADHALIDQARTPLIISGNPAGNRRAFERAWRAVEGLVRLQAEAVSRIEAGLDRAVPLCIDEIELLARLLASGAESEVLRSRLARDPHLHRRVSAVVDRDRDDDDNELAKDLLYLVDSRRGSVTLTEKGQHLLEDALGPIFDTSPLERRLSLIQADTSATLQDRRRLTDRLQRQLFRQNNRMSQVYQMLRASVLLKRDVDYVLVDGQVVLIDESTGRTLPENRFRWGLHAALEAKEGVTVNPEHEALAQISVQGYMGLYSHVAGMTGTALEAQDEFERAYGLKVVCVDPSRPSARVHHGARLYSTRLDKLAAITDEVESCRRIGRPVLVGTLTIEQSQEISRLLRERGIEHSLLNAVTNAAEAEIIKKAGSFGAVTIATNMAGRGTDITLEPGLDRRVAEEYGRLVLDLLDNHGGPVEVTCGTQKEAVRLRNALDVLNGLTVSDGGDFGPCASVLVVSRRDEPFSDKRVRLDFGLGLYVIATEKNQTARVDRQLRGRSGRQGAFGASRFILSLEDRFLQFRGDNTSCLVDGPHVDGGGRRFYQGPRMERHLTRVQRQTESDDEAGRSLGHQCGRVLEAQAGAYYRGRREIVETGSFHDVCLGFVEGWAVRLLRRHFADQWPCDYTRRFERMAEDLWLDAGIDCDGLYGTGPDGLAAGVAHLVTAKLEDAQASLGEVKFTSLEKLLFLRTADEFWRDHLARQEECVLNITLGYLSVTAAMAELRVRGFEAYELFKTGTIDAFLPRLLAFPMERASEGDGEKIDLSEDVLAILV